MQHSEQLAERLGSHIACEKSMALRTAVAVRHKNDPLISSLRSALDRDDVRTAEQVLNLVQPMMDDPAWALSMVQDFVNAQVEDPFFIPPVAYLRSDAFAGLQIFYHPKVRLTLSSCDIHLLGAKKASADGSGSIGLTGHLTLFKFIKAGDARLSLWSGLKADGANAFGKDSCIVPSGALHLRDGDTLLLDGRKDSFVIESARGSLVVLQATILVDRAPLMVFFSAAEKSFVTRSAADVVSSRVQMLSTMLRIMGRSDAIESMKPFFVHEDFFVRWHVMREALAMNAGEVKDELSTMARQDPHSDVRELAARTLRQLERLAVTSVTEN